MKVFYNSWIAKIFTMIKGYSTVMLFGAVFTEDSSVSERTIYHEQAHAVQYRTLFCAGLVLALIVSLFTELSWWSVSLILIPVMLFYVWYVIEYIIRLLLYRNHYRAYRNIVFEREAVALQFEYQKPEAERKYATAFSFMNFYKSKYEYY